MAMNQREQFSHDLRNTVYRGGETLVDMFSELEHAIKYPIAENKLTATEKVLIRKELEFMIEHLKTEPKKLAEMFDLDLD